MYYQLERLIYDLWNQNFRSKFGPLGGSFWPFSGSKNPFLGFLKVGLELFRSYLGIVLGLKRLTFRCIFSLKGRYMTSKIQNLCQILALREGHFDNFHGQTSCFLGFFKVGLGLFRSCWGIVLDSKRHTIIRDKVLPNHLSPLGSRVSPKTELGARGCVGGWVRFRRAYYLLALWTMLGRLFSSF